MMPETYRKMIEKQERDKKRFTIYLIIFAIVFVIISTFTFETYFNKLKGKDTNKTVQHSFLEGRK